MLLPGVSSGKEICVVYGLPGLTLAARNHGMNYSNFMHGLKVAGIQIDRKMLAELAVTDPEGFSALVEKAKEAVG